MWPKFANSKLFTILLSSTVSIILLIVTQRFTVARDDKMELKQELKSKASIHYVDQQDEILRREFQEADRVYREYTVKTIDEINTNLREIRNYIHAK